MALTFLRTLRTQASERFLIQEDGQEIAALELHYVGERRVAGTLICFESSRLSDDRISSLLTTIDELLLPDVTLDSGEVTFTVVVGRTLGAFEAVKP